MLVLVNLGFTGDIRAKSARSGYNIGYNGFAHVNIDLHTLLRTA